MDNFPSLYHQVTLESYPPGEHTFFGSAYILGKVVPHVFPFSVHVGEWKNLTLLRISYLAIGMPSGHISPSFSAIFMIILILF